MRFTESMPREDGEVVAGVEIVTAGPYPSALAQPDSYRHPVNSSTV